MVAVALYIYLRRRHGDRAWTDEDVASVLDYWQESRAIEAALQNIK